MYRYTYLNFIDVLHLYMNDYRLSSTGGGPHCIEGGTRVFRAEEFLRRPGIQYSIIYFVFLLQA